jgi:FPC/CPF motif-containing protein YcgG
MKVTPIVLLLLFTGMTLSMKCIKETDDCHYYITLNNQSDKRVYLVVTYDYPDTSMNFQNPRYHSDLYQIAAKSNDWIKSGPCIESNINNSPGKKISLFIFDAELVDATPWNQVRQNYQVLKRMDLTAEEIDNAHYSIDFQ